MKLKVLCVAAGVLTLTGCGQKGPLYLPDKPGDVVTRPAARPVQTPPSAPQPATASPPDQSKPPDENQAK